ncbi:MAG: glycoside hydrolase family 65 protein [Anaerolineales bacterium]|nr:glycoside hydrolase family 65 protein [Anaerolineales bacterium]
MNSATWQVTEPAFDPLRQHHSETILTLGNGYLSTRGTFEERYPNDRQATLVHGMWDDVPIAFTELANTPDWTALEIWVDGHRFDMQEGQITNYARCLDLRTGRLQRRLRWTPAEDIAVELSFERFASLDDEHLLAVSVRVTPLSKPAEIKVRAMLDSRVENDGLLHWQQVSQHSDAGQADLVVRTRHTGKTLAMSTRLGVSGGEAHLAASDCPGCPGIVATAQAEAGQPLVIVKSVAIYTSRDSSDPLAAAQAKVQTAATAGYAALREANKSAWADFWEASDVIIEGDDEAQLAVRHALFQVRIAAPTHDERASIPAKTLSGFGYRGHVFWDNEIFVLPFFTFTQPNLARNMLMYRYHTLPGARRKAAANSFSGAQYAWESAETGDEVTPTWGLDFDDPTKLVRIWTGDIQIHISADIAYAMHQYWRVTGDDDFWQDVGAPVVLETAVFWGDRAEAEGDRFAIRDIIGPDEYHDHVDNNAYTNHMVRWHLKTAQDALEWLWEHDPGGAGTLVEKLDLTPERLTHWRKVIDGLILAHDPETGLIEQFEGFFDLEDVDWPAYEGRTKSMQELLDIEESNHYKVLKQADVIALLCLFDDAFDQKTWQANWDYYVPITDHAYGSSLGPAMHAWAACRMGQPDLAYEHFMRAARADLSDVRGNAWDGIHAASAGGLWEAVVFGFAGLRLTENGPTFKPQLPTHWRRVVFNIIYRGERRRIELSR